MQDSVLRWIGPKCENINSAVTQQYSTCMMDEMTIYMRRFFSNKYTQVIFLLWTHCMKTITFTQTFYSKCICLYTINNKRLYYKISNIPKSMSRKTCFQLVTRQSERINYHYKLSTLDYYTSTVHGIILSNFNNLSKY